jgi:hypothetical protein
VELPAGDVTELGERGVNLSGVCGVCVALRGEGCSCARVCVCACVCVCGLVSCLPVMRDVS